MSPTRARSLGFSALHHQAWVAGCSWWEKGQGLGISQEASVLSKRAKCSLGQAILWRRMQLWAWGMGPPHGFGVGHQEHRCHSLLTIETAVKFTWKPMFCFRCLKLKSPYNICSRGRPLWGLCQKCSRGIYKNQWAPNWNLQMEQQNFPSWLDWKIMEVGIMRKWENKFQRWSLASAIVRVPWEMSEQAMVTEVKFIVLLWVGRCCCVVTVLTAEGPNVRCEVCGNHYQPCSKPRQGQAWVLRVLCYHQYFGSLLSGPSPKHAAFTVSERMWCQLSGEVSVMAPPGTQACAWSLNQRKENGVSKANTNHAQLGTTLCSLYLWNTE